MPYVLVVVGYAFILMIDRVLIDSHSVDATKSDGGALLSDNSDSELSDKSIEELDKVEGPFD